MKKLLGAMVAFIAFGAFSTFIVVQARQIGYNQGYAPDQPVAFSHAKHAGELEIDCQYCHYGADKGRHANIPPTETCLNCHSQVKTNSPEIRKLQASVDSGENIQWVKVNFLPDFAYFNHAQHVNVGGISCQKCHGPVQEMEIYYQHETLGMGWCINCHRENGIAPPEDHPEINDVYPDTQEGYPAGAHLYQGSGNGGDCSKCHY
ncbi:MAG: hypothetical protein CME65_13700 [Halobacteriovoraceae bacterium]|nr:hypothetical protein [Halobacteriovoraceae bacterium]|tara:strand:- start:16750 stop:17364 length:615 start_codon:yes stop_codon:yes gene_type:complete